MIIKKGIVLNFWHALLLLLCTRLVCALFYVIMVLLFKDSYKTVPFQILLEYVQILLFVPFIFWFAKKTDTKFKDSLFLPDISTIIKMFVVVVLAETIVLSPLFNFDLFFESVKNSKLRIFGTTISPLPPLLGLRMVLIINLHGVLIVPIVEELFFRGLVLKNFLKMYSPVYAILLSSLLFGVHHLSVDNLIFYIFLGILFGILYYTTNSLILVMLAHIIWNVFSLLKREYIELDMTSSILHLFIYITAFIVLFFILKKSLKPVNRIDAVKNIKG